MYSNSNDVRCNSLNILLFALLIRFTIRVSEYNLVVNRDLIYVVYNSPINEKIQIPNFL